MLWTIHCSLGKRDSFPRGLFGRRQPLGGVGGGLEGGVRGDIVPWLPVPRGGGSSRTTLPAIPLLLHPSHGAKNT